MSYGSQRRLARLALNLCPDCPNEIVPGRTMCRRCLDVRSKATEKFTSLGLCLCGRVPVKGKKRCEKHQLYSRIYNLHLPKSEQARAIEAAEKFDGICPSCGAKTSGCLDHKGDKFRGIICKNCNFALGLAKDSCQVLTNLIQYLKGEL